MKVSYRALIAAASFVALLSSTRASAQTPKAAGHWEGGVQAPGRDVAIQVDIAPDERAGVPGTISVPSQNLRALPLQAVAVDGSSVRFEARTDQTFAGVLSADGRSIAGEFEMAAGSVPFVLTRTGDARIEPPVESDRIDNGLEGTWTGSLSAGDGAMRLVLTMENRSDGKASGRVVNLDEGGLTLPVRIVRHGAEVTLESSVVPSSFVGRLSADGSEIAGELHERGAALPLVFRRAQ
jgi:hypothetical protein